MKLRANENSTILDFFRQEAEAFDRAHASDPGWLRHLRQKAAARFAERGFPTTRDEEWRHTPLGPLYEAAFSAGETPGLARGAVLPFAAAFRAPHRLVFVNGQFVSSLSAAGTLAAGISVGSLADALAARPEALGFHLARTARFDEHAFRALNTAFLHDGALVEIPANLVIEEPIHLMFVSSVGGGAAASHPRALIIGGENSQVRIIESHAGPDGCRYFTNAVTEIVAGAGAVVDHCRVQLDGNESFHVGSTQASVGRQASYTSHAVSFGASISRCDIDVTLAGDGGTCTLNGLYLASGEQLIDHHTTIDHARPHCTSHELYKGILAGHARAVFSGRIQVRPDAQKTDAKQTNRTLLLSDEAQINTKPQLEILANDVRCTHGATVGQLNDDALFYLRSRGLGRDEARRMLIRAFAGEVLGRIPLEEVRDRLEELLSARLVATNAEEVRS